MKVCEFPNCNRTAHFLMGWNNENGNTRRGLVCATCDRRLGRINLTKTGMPLEEAILFERYLAETVNLLKYPDFPEWLRLYKRTCTGPIELLDLSTETRGALRRNGIITIEELAVASREALLEIRTLGHKRVDEIRKKLEAFRDG